VALQPTLKLTYFNGTGRAEITRLLLSAAGIAFEDIRLSGVRGHASSAAWSLC
jgi:hypothetical protein